MSTNVQATERYHPLARCEECPLFDENTFVPSDGPEHADVILVGEAPGLNETRTGKPFTGKSGQLLNMLLQHSGLEREEVFITNVCLCRPRSNANPPKQAIRSCKDRLDSEIVDREPKTIVSLGNFASRAILGTSTGITKLRVGPPKDSYRFPGVRVVATYHPAASLYNQAVFPDIVTDFGKIKGVGNVSANWVQPNFKVFDDPSEACAALNELLHRDDLDRVAIDIEVGIEKDISFAHPDRYRLLCVGLSYSNETAIVIGERACDSEDVLDVLGRILEVKKLVAQNGKFDLQGLWKIGHGRLFFDTMLAHYALDERRGIHSLGQMGIEYLGAPSWKDEIDRYLGPSKNYADIPRESLYKYNAYDVVVTFRLMTLFEKQLEEAKLTGVHDFLVRSSDTLMHMERNGIQVDLDYLIDLEDEYKIRLAALERELLEWVDNPRSPKQVKEALQALGVRTDTTNVEVLTSLQERSSFHSDSSLHDFVSYMLTYRKEHKLYGTYIKGTRTRVYNGRIYPSFLLHGTVTGRLSSRNPNIQNVPRGSIIRRLYVSGPGKIFVQADFKQAELRVVCGLSQDTYLHDVFADVTRDIHGEVATRFYGPNWTKEQRVRAKAIVFGIIYGREAYSLAAEYHMSGNEAQNYINQFFRLIPNVVEWIDNLEKQVLEGHDLVSPFGRHRRFWLITNMNRKSILKEARAFLPQSTASDLTLESANRLAEQGYSEYLRFPVHDSLVLEVPEDEVQEVIQATRNTMEEVGHELFDGYVEFPVDVSTGTNWGDL